MADVAAGDASRGPVEDHINRGAGNHASRWGQRNGCGRITAAVGGGDEEIRRRGDHDGIRQVNPGDVVGLLGGIHPQPGAEGAQGTDGDGWHRGTDHSHIAGGGASWRCG